jgi:hypothetical protein
LINKLGFVQNAVQRYYFFLIPTMFCMIFSSVHGFGVSDIHTFCTAELGIGIAGQNHFPPEENIFPSRGKTEKVLFAFGLSAEGKI